MSAGGAASTAAPFADERVAALVRWFETLTPESLPQIARLYRDDARFKDPFNDVVGVARIQAVFEHMFATLREPRFVVRSVLVEGDAAFLTWDFTFRRDAAAGIFTIHGATRILFDRAGRVALHRDYWDAAEELYAKLPLIGVLVRWLTRRLAAPQRRG